MRRTVVTATLVASCLVVAAVAASSSGGAQATAAAAALSPDIVGTAAAFDKTPPLSQMKPVKPSGLPELDEEEDGAASVQTPHEPDGALQTQAPTGVMPAPSITFEGPSNEDNFRIFGGRVNPPDPNGDVGPRHFVAMTNLTFAVYSKQTGRALLGPIDTGTLWQGFPIEDCTEPSGDPIVLYDEISDRWILTQFTTSGLDIRNLPFYNCIAVSQTSDPTGAYFRYAFKTAGKNFPDYPKYGLMPDSLFVTTREFEHSTAGGNEILGIYAINRRQLVAGNPNTQFVRFDLNQPVSQVGDGILPADLDGSRLPPAGSPEYFVGSMDDDAGDHAPFDALNVFQANVDWSNPAAATFAFEKSVPIAPFDTIFPCAPTARDCLPQPGITNPDQFLDILSYRERPLWRLQYRNFGTYETLVTNQSVEARPGVAGIRWWELRNPRNAVLHQEGTWAPNDGIHRWMGSVALDKQGNLALGYSVVNATNVFPGIRYAGRLNGDPLGQLTQAEAVLQNGSGVQTTTNSRWGDYTSMSVDPKDGCTFWYMNEYYARSGTPADPRPWQTRIGAFKFPSCT
jgi:hypothetical protein